MGEEPERLRALVANTKAMIGVDENISAETQRATNEARAALDALLAEVERLARDNSDLHQTWKATEKELAEAREEVERLAGERDTLRDDRARADAAAGTTHTRAVKAEMECERLAGRVAALEAEIEAAHKELDGLGVPRVVSPADVGGSE